MSKADPAVGVIEKTLRAEAAGEVDRREQLTDVLREQPDFSAARWQAGFVREGKTWRSFDESPAVTDSGLSAEYASQRDQAQATCAGQLKLAKWCKRHALADQERAHLWAALESAGEADRPEVLSRLGYLPVGDRWLSRADLLLWRERNQRALNSLKRWGPRLEKISQQLEGLPTQRETARKGLSQLTDPDVIPALEYLLCGNPAAAGLAVETLKRWPDAEATLALVKQAVFSQWPEIRQQATTALKGRPLEVFAPGVIALMATAVRTSSANHGMAWFEIAPRWGSVDNPRGAYVGAFVLQFSYLIARETNDQFQVGVLNTTDYRVGECLQGKTIHFLEEARGPAELGPWTVKTILLLRQSELNRERVDYEYQMEKLVDDMNERTDELNRRVINVLAVVSGQDAVSDIKAWWRWWDDYSDTQNPYDKPVVVKVDEDYVGDPSTHYYRMSCFAAGTPVWTERGVSSIENIKVGDRVLAQNVETGELAYKPVLKTTVRPPKELTTLRLDAETIVCTGGHRFWNSGSGWIKARDIEPQSMLHTVTGNLPVWSARKGESAETYNLVVADFHTYFVGKTGLLSQDLLLPPPTNNVVPGLSRSNAVAQARK